MTTSPAILLTSDELDELATTLAQKVAAGTVAEREARMTIFEAVFRTDIISSETLKWCRKNNVPRHLHDDMVEAAYDFYTRKILDLPSEAAANDDEAPKDSTGRNGKKFFDLAVFVDGASAAGSIRQALSNYTLMRNTLFRSVYRVHNRGQVVVSTDLLEENLEPDSAFRGLISQLPVQEDTAVTSVIDAGRADRIGALVDLHSDAVNGQRGASRTRIDASFVRQAFGLPELQRPLDPQTRWQMMSWIEEDSSLAYRSITAFFIPDNDPRVAEMGVLWTDYEDQHLEAITSQEMSHQVAELLVRDSLSDRPRPGKPALSRLRARVKDAVAGCGLDAQWPARLVGIYLDHEHEERSAWDVERAGGSVVRNPQAFLLALAEASALPGSPLGQTPSEVCRTLAAMVGDAREATAKRRPRSQRLSAA